MAPPGTQTILAADIGGTHSRFALFHIDASKNLLSGALTLVRKARFATTASGSTADMMRLLASVSGDDGGYFTPQSREPVAVDAAVFAIPGPTAVADPSFAPPQDEVCFCPNISWPLEAAPVKTALSGAPVRFVNDFVANGFACALLPGVIDAVTVLEGEAKPGFPKAVIGAGTGLGHCLILPGDPVSIAGSEAGHALFPFAPDEIDIALHYAAQYERDEIDNDMAIAGRGLSILYEFCTGEKHPPHKVAPLAALNGAVLALAAKFYGRAVRHYILNTLALGGVFITGGLAANLPGILTHPAFEAEFRKSEAVPAILAHVPVHHVLNHDTGLWGSAAYAALSL